MSESSTALKVADALGAASLSDSSRIPCSTTAPEDSDLLPVHLDEVRPGIVCGPDDVDPDAETQYGYSRCDDDEDFPFSPESAPTAIVTTPSNAVTATSTRTPPARSSARNDGPDASPTV